jgi:type IV secretory pathway TrbL component
VAWPLGRGVACPLAVVGRLASSTTGASSGATRAGSVRRSGIARCISGKGSIAGIIRPLAELALAGAVAATGSDMSSRRARFPRPPGGR